MEKSIYDKMVKRTVLYGVALWSVLFLLASGWAYMAYGDYKEIEEEKDTLKEKITKLQEIEKTGINFNDFKAQKSEYSNNKNLTAIVDLIEEDFYEGSFKNTENENFKEFIEQKGKETEERLKSEEEREMRDISKTVLPSFSLYDLDFSEDNSFSELRFVNYVERIMQTFNLEYTGDMGIADVLPIETEESKDAKKASEKDLLMNKIFYIPLSFTLEGNKASIIDFIYFVEKVGNVNVSSESLEIYSDNFFEKGSKNYRNADLVLEGDSREENYNPYLNQLIDIESITFEEYIYEKQDGDIRGEFLSNIRKIPQGLQEYKADVVLRFYVKGISDFKVEEKYNATVLEVTSYSKDIQNAIKALQSLKTREKTPEVALLIKRLITYQELVSQLEQNSKKFRELAPEQIYKDILSSLDIKRLLKNDLEVVSSITGMKLTKKAGEIPQEGQEEQSEENIEENSLEEE